VLCFRDGPGSTGVTKSIVLELDLGNETFGTLITSALVVNNNFLSLDSMLKVVGWEKSAKGRAEPKEIDLAPMMDPHK
jgi:hypothetical protein